MNDRAILSEANLPPLKTTRILHNDYK